MSSGAAVNVPTNYKLKESDVNKKLQLYGIYAAFANGKVPSNKQIDVALNSALAQTPLASPSKKLSADGQKLVADLRDVIEKAKYLVLTKNEGNLLQDFIWQTQNLSAQNTSTPNAPIDKDSARQHGNQALDGLRTLGTLLVSNGQFRKLLSDATILARDIAGDAASKAAHKVNPSKDELNQIDDAADDNTWHDVPDMSRDNIKGQINARKPFSRDDARAAADKAGNTAQNQGRGDDVDARQGAATGLSHLKDTAQQNVPDEHQDRMREYRDRGNNYLNDKVPQERRDQTIWRLKKMVAEIQGHQDYQQAIETLLRLAEQYAGHGRNLADQSTGTVKGAHSDDSLRNAEVDLKTIIERFANSTSTDDLFEAINDVYRDADRDPELKNFFKSFDRYIRRCLQEQGFVLQDAATEEWNQLYDKGNFLLRDRYRDHTDRVLDEFKFFGEQFDKDPQNKAFGESMQRLFNDLGQDQNGQAEFKPHLLKDLSEVIIPGFFEHIRYVPIPRIEYSDPMIDAVVENLVLEGDNLAPNVMEFGSDNYWRWGRKQIASRNKNKVMLSVSGVQCDLRDVSYYIKKKQGFPGVTDKGVMDIVLSGSGLGFKVAMETADRTDRTHFFKVNTVDVSIKNMNIIVKQSNHKLLFKMFKPLLMKVMTPVIQKVVEKQVRDNIHQLDAVLYQIHQSAKQTQRDAAEQVKADPQNAPNVFSNYTNAAKDYITQQKRQKEQTAKAKADDKQFNLAVTQHESLFPNIRLPGGISTKATEYKDLARKGDRWESPIFGIGSAKESTNLPKINPITRKREHVQSPSVRGGNHPGQSSSGQGYDGTSGYGSSTSGGNYGSSTTGGNYGSSTTGGNYGSSNVGGANYGSSGLSGSQLGATSAGGPNHGHPHVGATLEQEAYGTAGGNLGTSATATAGVPAGYGREAGYVGGTANEAQGFRNEVDQAFEGEGVVPDGSQHTTLGKNNPVFTGRA